MRVVLAGVSVDIDRTPILRDVDLDVAEGEFVGLVGPNGSGKSTLVRSLYRAFGLRGGSVTVGGDDLAGLPAREIARRVAVLAQEMPGDFDFTVRDLVAMGRIPHLGTFAPESPQDKAAVESALASSGAAIHGDRVFATLSGGQKQRVLVAKALAQASPVLVLDEPTNHLDIRAQLELLELIRAQGITTVAALHELNLAAAYCDRIYVLREGRLIAEGAPGAVLTPELMADVFGVHATCGVNPVTGRVQLAFSPLPTPVAGTP